MSLLALAVVFALAVVAVAYVRALRRWDAPLRGLAVAAPASQCLLLAFFAAIASLESFFEDVLPATVAAALLCLIADIVALPLFRRAQTKEIEEQRAEAASEFARATAWRTRQLEAEAASAAQVRDQMAAQLREVAALLDGHGEGGAAAHLESLAAAAAAPVRFCANETADAVLSLKAEAAARDAVPMEVSADIPEGLVVGDADLCAVLSNMIDNALAAARAVEGEGRFVDVRARVAGRMLAVEVSNGFAPAAGKENRRPRDRRGVGDHGWGLEILQDVASRYHGTFETRAEGEIWHASCLLQAK